MTNEDAITIGKRILDMTTTDYVTVWVTHTARGTTRVANGRVMGGDDGEELTIEVSVQAGKRSSIKLTVDQSDDVSLRATVEQAEALARLQLGEAVNLEALPFGPQEYPPVKLWHAATAHALTNERHTVVPRMISIVRDAGFEGAAFVGGIERTQTILRKDGLVANCRETDLECTVTARAMNGMSSGWAGNASRVWSTLDPIGVATRAVDVAARAVNPVAFEPGRRTVILSPAAVAQFLQLMPYAFSSMLVNRGQSPFAKSFTMGGTKVGVRVIDPRLAMRSDPADADGGYAPFYDTGEVAGIPVNAINWIEDGVLKTLSYGIGEALKKGRQHHMTPRSVRLMPVQNTATMTVDEMIANCAEGIYVNRVSGMRLIEQKTGMMTGVTRDGCFLIKNGKFEKSLKNFRFTDSPFFFLNNVAAVGAPERAAFGHVSDVRWPLPPIIAPALTVRDFNFTALSDAV